MYARGWLFKAVSVVEYTRYLPRLLLQILFPERQKTA